MLEVSLWLLSLEQLKNDTAKLNKDRTTCEKQLADAKQQQGTLYAQSEQLAESLREIDRETERLRNELREAEQFAAEQISREAVIQANIRNCEENIERTRQESAHRAEQVQSMDAQLAERRERISVLNEQEKAEEKTNILNALNFARKVIATQECDFLLLDEILALPDYGITTAEAIGDILKMKDESMHILLTGRTLPDSLRKYADSITTLTTEIV